MSNVYYILQKKNVPSRKMYFYYADNGILEAFKIPSPNTKTLMWAKHNLPLTLMDLHTYIRLNPDFEIIEKTATEKNFKN